MDNTQHTYFAELELVLQKADYSVRPVEDGLLPIEWNDRRLCQVTENGDIRFRMDDITDPAAEVARGRVTDIAGVVRGVYDAHRAGPRPESRWIGREL